MNNYQSNKKYVSEIDEFLYHFDLTAKKSQSQEKESKEYQSLFYQRDTQTKNID